MKKQTAKATAWIGMFAVIGLLVPMADGCHKHSKVKRAQGGVVQLASTPVQNPAALANLQPWR